jgi:hypothetical protein
MASGGPNFPTTWAGPPAADELLVPAEALIFGRAVVAGPAAKPLGVRVAEVLGRGKAHRRGYRRHRLEAVRLQQLPGLVQAQLTQPAHSLSRR